VRRARAATPTDHRDRPGLLSPPRPPAARERQSYAISVCSDNIELNKEEEEAKKTMVSPAATPTDYRDRLGLLSPPHRPAT